MQNVVETFFSKAIRERHDKVEAAREEMDNKSFGIESGYKHYVEVLHAEIAAWLLDEYDLDVCFCNGVIVLNVAGMDIEYTPEGFDGFFMEVTA